MGLKARERTFFTISIVVLRQKNWLTEGNEVDNTETSLEFSVVYAINVHRFGPTKRRECRSAKATHSLFHPEVSPVYTCVYTHTHTCRSSLNKASYRQCSIDEKWWLK